MPKTRPAFLSRIPIKPEYHELREYEEFEKHVHSVITEGNFDAVKVDEIRESTKNDKSMHMLSESISKGIINADHKPELICYKSVFNETFRYRRRYHEKRQE